MNSLALTAAAEDHQGRQAAGEERPGCGFGDGFELIPTRLNGCGRIAHNVI